MHLLNLFSIVEGLPHPLIISPRQLPVQPFHHSTQLAELFAALLLCSLAHPALLFSPTLPSSSSSGNSFLMSLSLDQNTSHTFVRYLEPAKEVVNERKVPEEEAADGMVSKG